MTPGDRPTGGEQRSTPTFGNTDEDDDSDVLLVANEDDAANPGYSSGGGDRPRCPADDSRVTSRSAVTKRTRRRSATFVSLQTGRGSGWPFWFRCRRRAWLYRRRRLVDRREKAIPPPRNVGDCVFITSELSDCVLSTDSISSSTAPHHVYMRTKNISDQRQHWYLDNETRSIRNRCTHLCLEINDANELTVGEFSTDKKAQRWTFDADRCVLFNEPLGKVLDVAGQTTSRDGAVVRAFCFSGRSNQRWTLRAVDDPDNDVEDSDANTTILHCAVKTTIDHHADAVVGAEPDNTPQNKIRVHRRSLTRCIEPRSGLLSELVGRKAISSREMSRIKSRATRDDMVDELLDALVDARLPAVYCDFIDSLSANLQQHVVNLLEDKKVTYRVRAKFQPELHRDHETELSRRLNRLVETFASAAGTLPTDIEADLGPEKLEQIRSLIGEMEETGFRLLRILPHRSLAIYVYYVDQEIAGILHHWLETGRLEAILEFVFNALLHCLNPVKVSLQWWTELPQLALEVLETVLTRSVLVLWKTLWKATSKPNSDVYRTLTSVCYKWYLVIGHSRFSTATRRILRKSSPYLIHPRFVRSLQIDCDLVWGVAQLDNLIYALGVGSSAISVFDAASLSADPQYTIKLPDVKDARDMASSSPSTTQPGCLYVADLAGDCVWRVQTTPHHPGGYSVERWIEGRAGGPWKLSTAADGRLVVVCESRRVALYGRSSDVLVDGVRLPEFVGEPRHALVTAANTFVVCYDRQPARICEVNADGQCLRQSSMTGSSTDLKGTKHIELSPGGRILVADTQNSRILVLDRQLRLERVLLDGPGDMVNSWPQRLHLCAATGCLLVGMERGVINVYRVLQL